jgi:hypothetical protein
MQRRDLSLRYLTVYCGTAKRQKDAHCVLECHNSPLTDPSIGENDDHFYTTIILVKRNGQCGLIWSKSRVEGKRQGNAIDIGELTWMQR